MYLLSPTISSMDSVEFWVRTPQLRMDSLVLMTAENPRSKSEALRPSNGPLTQITESREEKQVCSLPPPWDPPLCRSPRKPHATSPGVRTMGGQAVPQKIPVGLNCRSDRIPFLDELDILIYTIEHRRCSFPFVQMAWLYCLTLDKL